jgi:uncharacterized SAM-binding protein YcdF (DUF218 family)
MDTRVKPAYDMAGKHPGASRLFFVFSKTVGLMLLPTNFLICLGLAGALLLATRFARLGRELVIAGAVLFAICGFSPLGYLLLYPLEQQFPPWQPAGGAPAGIVVLGGSIDVDVSAGRGVAVIASAADRILAAVALARRYPDARIVYSGGNPHLLSGDAREADYAASLFESLGISKERLIMERRSRNTEENAEFSMAIAAPKAGERWLLVTSAFHMPRAVGLFRKVGFAVEAYPVDWRVGGREDLLRFTAISLEGLDRVNVGLREWTGLAAYWATGKIDRLLPGPSPD